MIEAAVGDPVPRAASPEARSAARSPTWTRWLLSPLPGEPRAKFRYGWPLHVVRYAFHAMALSLIVADGRAPADAAWALIACSAVLLLDLVLHGRRARPTVVGALAFAVLQTPAALAVLSLAGMPAGPLVLGATLSGLALVLPSGAAGGIAVVTLAVALPSIGWSDGPGAVVALVATIVLSVAAGIWFARHADLTLLHRETLERLAEADERVSDLVETRRALAVADERRRLASEIHDELGHALVGTLIQLRVARSAMTADPAAAAERIRLIEESLSHTLGDLRQALQAEGSGGRARTRLSMSLTRLVREYASDAGPSITLLIEPDAEAVDDLPSEAAHALYRVAQEALTNAVRHGRAQHVEVRAAAGAERIHLTIRDDGAGVDEIAPGMGLGGMVTRVQEVGGGLRFRSAPGSGFAVEATVRRR